MNPNTTFDKWRIVPSPTTLLFNFKNAAKSENEAIGAIVKQYGREIVMCARQLKSKIIPVQSWIIVEACFGNDQARGQALRDGVTHNNILVIPVTSSSGIDPVTVMYFTGMVMFPTRKQIKMEVQDTVRIFLSDLKSELNDENIEGIWIELDCFEVYRGSATVILDRCIEDDRLTEVLMEYMDAPDYPAIKVELKRRYLYCNGCQTFDDHCTDDCDNVSAGRRKLATHQCAYAMQVKGIDSFCNENSEYLKK